MEGLNGFRDCENICIEFFAIPRDHAWQAPIINWVRKSMDRMAGTDRSVDSYFDHST